MVAPFIYLLEMAAIKKTIAKRIWPWKTNDHNLKSSIPVETIDQKIINH